MAEPQAGATIVQLELVHKRSADLLRKSLGASEIVNLWAIGLDDQMVALSQEHAFIIKWGFASRAPLGGMVVSLTFTDIVSADVYVRKTTAIFEIRAAGMPGAEAWPQRFRRTRAEELPNVVTIAPVQVRDFQRIATSIRERVYEATGPPVWIPPPR
jgi:hypothetical protein